ncbi:MAG: DUF4282 domain-containing protein [Rhizobium sp.]|nr:MAG: DUF4282 domain-containing protein [Rhizobium sp.]
MNKVQTKPQSAERSLLDRLAWVAEFFRGLADLEFRSLMTPRMMPALYLLGILASAWAVVAYTIEGFTISSSQGWVRAVLIAPVGFVVLVTLIRVALELCMVIFRIAVHINKMAGHTEEIAGGFPRITFWKSFKRKDE